MQTFNLRAKADKNGVIKVELPGGSANKEYELVVVVQPLSIVVEAEIDEMPLSGTGARMAYEAEKAAIHTDLPIDASQLSSMLRDDYGDYLFQRMNTDGTDE